MRIRYLLLNAYRRGGTIRTTLSMAAALAERGHDVEVASLLRPRTRPVFPVHPLVRLVPLTGSQTRRSSPGTRLGAARWASTVGLHRTPSRMVHPQDPRSTVLTRAHDLALRQYVSAQRDSVVIGTRLPINLALAGLRHDRQVAIAQEHSSLSRHDAVRAEYATAYPSLDAVAVLTDRDATAYRAVLGDSCPVVVMPNALAHGTPLRRSPLTAPVAVAAGALNHRKGFDLLIRAWRPIADEYPDWRVRIHGRGSWRARLQAQVDAAGLTGTVTLEGFVPDLASRLDEASLFVLPSRREGMPMVIIEAMAAGLPIVAFDCPTGPAELLEGGRSGILVPAGDVAGLTDGIRRIVSDERERRRLADAGALRARDFDPDVRAREWEQLFERLTDARGLSVGG